jgi:hypothetical protein
VRPRARGAVGGGARRGGAELTSAGAALRVAGEAGVVNRAAAAAVHPVAARSSFPGPRRKIVTKLSSKIVTGLAVLGLAGPALAVTGGADRPSSQTVKSVPARHHRVHRVAAADPKAADKPAEKAAPADAKAGKADASKPGGQGAAAQKPAPAPGGTATGVKVGSQSIK